MSTPHEANNDSAATTLQQATPTDPAAGHGAGTLPDKQRINQTIFEASKDSQFFQNKKLRSQRTTQRIARLQIRVTEAKKALAVLKPQARNALLHRAWTTIATWSTLRDLTRAYIYVDMDSFYAAVEMRDNPALKSVPLAVGGNAMICTSNYIAREYGVRAAMPGFIARKLCPALVFVKPNFNKYKAVGAQIRAIFADYDPAFSSVSIDEARMDVTEYIQKNYPCPSAQNSGSTSGQPSSSEKKRCSHHQHQKATEVPVTTTPNLKSGCMCDADAAAAADHDCSCSSDDSSQVEEDSEERQKAGSAVCSQHGAWMERAAIHIASQIRARIHQVTELTCSAGISADRMVAKIASDWNKPNGQFVVPFNVPDICGFMDNLPIRKIPGVGAVMQRTLADLLGIETCRDVRMGDTPLLLREVFSEGMTEWIILRSLGIHSLLPEGQGEPEEGIHNASSARVAVSTARSVGAGASDQDISRKSCSVERTFRPISSTGAMVVKIQEISETLERHLEAEGIEGSTVTLKLKLTDFSVISRSKTTSGVYVWRATDLARIATDLLLSEIESMLSFSSRTSPTSAMGDREASEGNGNIDSVLRPKTLTVRLIGIRVNSLRRVGRAEVERPASGTRPGVSARAEGSMQERLPFEILKPSLIEGDCETGNDGKLRARGDVDVSKGGDGGRPMPPVGEIEASHLQLSRLLSNSDPVEMSTNITTNCSARSPEKPLMKFFGQRTAPVMTFASVPVGRVQDGGTDDDDVLVVGESSLSPTTMEPGAARKRARTEM